MEFLCVSSSSAASDAVISVITVCLAAACFAGLIVALCRFAHYDDEVRGVSGKLVAILAVGFCLRLVFALCIRGSRDNYGVFETMINHLVTNGVKGYYRGSASGILYPIVYFVYLIFGGLSNAIGLSKYELGMQFMIKLPMIVCDLSTAFVIYKAASRYFNRAIALCLFAFVCVCPLFFIGSCVWTTELVFTSMFICCSCYFLARKNYIATIAFATAAAFSSIEGIYIFPIVCVYSLYHFVRAIIDIKTDKASAAVVWGEKYRAVIAVPLGVAASLICAYLIGLAMISSYGYGFFDYVYRFLLEPLCKWRYFTYDGLSVYAIFNRNLVEPGARFPAWLFACVFAAIIFAVVAVVYFTKRNRATLVLLVGFALITMQIYYPGSTAVGMESVLAVLLLGYALSRDKRIISVLFVLGLSYATNCFVTLANMGQLNNLGDYVLAGTGLPSSGIAAVTIVCAVLALSAHIYYTVVIVNIGMTGKKQMLSPQKGFADCMKEYFCVKKDV